MSMRFGVLAAVLLAALPAWAGTLPTSTATLPAADEARMIAAYRGFYEGQREARQPRQHVPGGKPAAPSPLTDAQIKQKIADDALMEAVGKTMAYERGKAAGAVKPITVPK